VSNGIRALLERRQGRPGFQSRHYTALWYVSTSVIKVEMDPQECDGKYAAKLRSRVVATVSVVRNHQKRKRGSEAKLRTPELVTISAVINYQERDSGSVPNLRPSATVTAFVVIN
jgi:hypothetical protein